MSKTKSPAQVARLERARRYAEMSETRAVEMMDAIKDFQQLFQQTSVAFNKRWDASREVEVISPMRERLKAIVQKFGGAEMIQAAGECNDRFMYTYDWFRYLLPELPQRARKTTQRTQATSRLHRQQKYSALLQPDICTAFEVMEKC